LYIRTEATQNLNVDIKAQSVGNLTIDIKAQTISDLKILAPSLKAVHIGGVKTRYAKVYGSVATNETKTLLNISGKGRFIELVVFLHTNSTSTYTQWNNIRLGIKVDGTYVIYDTLPWLDKCSGGLNSERLQNRATGTYTFEPIADATFNVLCVELYNTGTYSPIYYTDLFPMFIREIGFIFKIDIEFESQLLVQLENTGDSFDYAGFVVYGLYP
jgi:hypothetical protein